MAIEAQLLFDAEGRLADVFVARRDGEGQAGGNAIAQVGVKFALELGTHLVGGGSIATVNLLGVERS